MALGTARALARGAAEALTLGATWALALDAAVTCGGDSDPTDGNTAATALDPGAATLDAGRFGEVTPLLPPRSTSSAPTTRPALNAVAPTTIQRPLGVAGGATERILMVGAAVALARSASRASSSSFMDAKRCAGSTWRPRKRHARRPAGNESTEGGGRTLPANTETTNCPTSVD